LRKLIPGVNDFATKHPELLDEWHPTLNGTSKPEQYLEFSNKKAWWLCRTCGNVWEASFNKRANGRGCKICGHIRAAQKFKIRASENGNNLAKAMPELLEEWHPTKNEGMDPTEFAPHSNIKVWWKCKVCGNEWEATVNKRTNGRGCPKCAFAFKTSEPEQAVFYYIKKYFKDAQNSWSPEWLEGKSVDIFVPTLMLAIEYDGGFYHNEWQLERDATKTRILKEHGIDLIRVRERGAVDIIDGSFVIESTKCDEDLYPLEKPLEEIFEHIRERYSLDITPDVNIDRDYAKIVELFLERKRKNSLAVKYPDIAKEWHPTKNKDITPYMVAGGNKIKVWWICPNGHEYKSALSSRTRENGSGCPYCAGKTALVGFNDLATTHPELAAEWNYEKNGSLTPQMITAGSPRIVWWKGKCGHEWDAALQPRAQRGVGCPYCSNKKVLVGFNDLATTHPILASEWHPAKNGDLKPTDIVAGYNGKAYWVCQVCGYEWNAQVNSRANAGNGCPLCANRVIKPGYNDFASKYPEIAAEWDYDVNGDLRPENYSPGSSMRVAWKCSKCDHRWKTAIINRVKSGPLCAKCKREKD